MKRLKYTRRFVNVTMTGGKRKVCMLAMLKKDCNTNVAQDEPQPCRKERLELCGYGGALKFHVVRDHEGYCGRRRELAVLYERVDHIPRPEQNELIATPPRSLFRDWIVYRDS